MGRINLSIFTGFLVKLSPTNVAFVTIRFHDLLLFFPDFMTLNISSSAIPLTFGKGTSYLAALSFRFCLTAVESALASFWPSRSSRYIGRAASGTVEESACFTFRSSWAFRVFRSCTFSACLLAWSNLALSPKAFWASAEERWTARASRLRLRPDISRIRDVSCWRRTCAHSNLTAAHVV